MIVVTAADRVMRVGTEVVDWTRMSNLDRQAEWGL